MVLCTATLHHVLCGIWSMSLSKNLRTRMSLLSTRDSQWSWLLGSYEDSRPSLHSQEVHKEDVGTTLQAS